MQTDVWRHRGVGREPERVLGKMKCNALSESSAAVFPKPASVSWTRHLTDVTRVLRAACTLRTLTHCKPVFAEAAWRCGSVGRCEGADYPSNVAAWRCGAVCRSAEQFSQRSKFNFFLRKLTFNIFEADDGHPHELPSLKGTFVCFRALIVGTNFHLCVFEVQSPCPALLRVFLPSLVFAKPRLASANDLLLL